MAQRGSKVGKRYADTTFSSGDSKATQRHVYQEENNNEIDELSKDLTKMGCIVGAAKRPPNICVETCIYESGGEDDPQDNYSDEFEEEANSENESEKLQKLQTVVNRSKGDSDSLQTPSALHQSKSQSTVTSNTVGSVSGKSSKFGSVSVPSTRRINMSFTNERLREIERHNHILLNKIISARNNKKSSIPPREQALRKTAPPANVHRRQQQRQIDHDNMILLKKIQRAKSSALSLRR